MSILCTLCGKEYPSEKHLQNHIANTDCSNEDQQVKRKCSTSEIDRIYEETHGTKIVRKKGTPQHLIQSVRTLTGYNSRRAGYSPAHEMTIRKVKPSQSPLV